MRTNIATGTSADPTGRPAVLVVDDDPGVCAACSRILSEEGCEVRTAWWGGEALRWMEERRFDLALIDLRLPGPSGLSVLRSFRRMSPETQAVMITGYPSLESAKEAIRLGAFAYVEKPFTPQTMSSIVARALECKSWSLQRRWKP